jgi:hypothetical protein
MKKSKLRTPSTKVSKGLSGAIAAAALASTGLMVSQAALAEEPVYPVVSPLGEETVEMIEMAPRLDTLSDKTVCMVSNRSFKVNITMPAIAKALQESYPGLEIVPSNSMPIAYSRARWDEMPGEFRSKGCDAVISGNGG